MKLMINPININQVNTGEALLIGIHPFSHSLNNILELEETLTLIKQTTNDVYIYLNHLINNQDTSLLEEYLKQLSKTKISGILFEDYAVLQIVKELNLNIPLVLASKNGVTSSPLIENIDVDSALVSNDLSLDDLNNLLTNVTKPVIINAYGYQNIYYSKRPVIKSYLSTFNLKENNSPNYLKSSENCYQIDEIKGYSYIYSDKIFNLVNHLDKLVLNNVSYLYLNSYHIELEVFEQDLNIYRSYLMDQLKLPVDLDESYSVYQIINPNYYKVKDHE